MGIEEIEHSAGGVVFKESKTGPLYLILISKRRIWEFPKGHLEPGEDTKMAALREVKEETGLSELELFDGFSFKIIYEFFKNGNKVKKDVVYYLMKTNSQMVTISDEHIGYMWLSYEKALNTLTHKNSKNLLREANSWLMALYGSWRA